MGMFPSPFPTSPPHSKRTDVIFSLDIEKRATDGSGKVLAAWPATTHPRALLVRWTRLPGGTGPARSTRCDSSPGSMVGLVSAGPRTHVGDPVDKTPPPNRQPVAPRAPDRVCRAARRADGDLPFGQDGFRRSAVRGRVASQSRPEIATHRRARADRARNPLRQHQRPFDERLMVRVVTAWAEFASPRGIGSTEPDTAVSGLVHTAARREGELADHAAVDRCSAKGAALPPEVGGTGRSDGVGGRRRRLPGSHHRLRG
jgi:hypothetical protein